MNEAEVHRLEKKRPNLVDNACDSNNSSEQQTKIQAATSSVFSSDDIDAIAEQLYQVSITPPEIVVDAEQLQLWEGSIRITSEDEDKAAVEFA